MTQSRQQANDQPLLGSLIGQAAAGITLAASLVYAAGALSIVLRLYFTRLPWSAIIGQLPHDVIITTGFGQVILPAALMGLLGAILVSFLVNQPVEPGKVNSVRQFAHLRLSSYLFSGPGFGHFAAWLVASLVIGAAEAGASVYNYINHTAAAHYTTRTGTVLHHVTISWLSYLVIVTVICTVAAGVALILMPTPLIPTTADPDAEPTLEEKPQILQAPRAKSKLRPWQWSAVTGALIAVAVIPGLAAVSASTLFPPAYACSPGADGTYISGNLIATSNGWAYMIEYRDINNKLADFFSVVPLSTVQVLTIGRYGDCYLAHKLPAPK